MAVSLKLTAGNLQARIEGVAKDAREAKLQATGLGRDYAGVEEVKMAADIITQAAEKASKLLQKAKRI